MQSLQFHIKPEVTALATIEQLDEELFKIEELAKQEVMKNKGSILYF